MIGANDITSRTASGRRHAGWAGRSGACAPATPSSWSAPARTRGHHRHPQPLRWVARGRGLRLARAQAAAVRSAGGVPVPFSDLLAPEFRKAPEQLFSHDMFHPSAAGYALAAKQLLPALCNALGEFIDGAQPEDALESRSADGSSLLARSAT